jgi:uncharacterized membrane protein
MSLGSALRVWMGWAVFVLAFILALVLLVIVLVFGAIFALASGMTTPKVKDEYSQDFLAPSK